jgi:hypothetical protein
MFVPCVLQAALLVGQGGASLIPTVGLVVGFAVAAGMLAYNTQRALDLQYNDGDWVSLSYASRMQRVYWVSSKGSVPAAWYCS